MLVRHIGLANQRKDKLATLAVRHHTHRIVDDHTRGELDIVIHDTKAILLGKPDPDPAERRIGHPSIRAFSQLRAGQTGRPLREVRRVGCEGVDVSWSAGDGDADVLYLMHGVSALAGFRMHISRFVFRDPDGNAGRLRPTVRRVIGTEKIDPLTFVHQQFTMAGVGISVDRVFR